MIDVFDLWEKFRGNINTQQGGHVQPHRNFLSWVNDISADIFQREFATSWEKSQKVDDDLGKPFLETVNIEVVNGVVKYPDNYGHYSNARLIVRRKDNKIGFMPGAKMIDHCGKEIKETDNCPSFIDPEVWEIMQSQKEAQEKIESIDVVGEDEFGFMQIVKVDNSRWPAATGHRFLKPTLLKPKITQYKGGWMIAPTKVKVIVLDYLRKPALAEFKYTVQKGDPVTGQGDNIVYDQNSKKLEWDSLMINVFLTNLEKKYGKYIREEFIWQTSESDRKEAV